MVSIFKAIRDNDIQLVNYFIDLATHDASSSSTTQAVSKQTSQWIQQQLKSSGQKQFDLNKRSSRGKTALHYAVTWNRVEMAAALINCAQVDVNVRDRENGWTALHRCLYLGHLEIARFLMKRQDIDLFVKDWEGLDAFELYNLTVANTFPKERVLSKQDRLRQYDDTMEKDEAHYHTTTTGHTRRGGTDLYTWGHNTNYVLGHVDTENRTKPERVKLQLESQKSAFFLQRPDYLIETVVMSKYHMGILTTENSHNLLLCGFGSGGRLGTGKETDTQFTPVPVPWPERITSVALGRDHTLAVTENGSVISFGSNSFGQLGYETDHHGNKNPMQLVPRKIQAQSLKKQPILGAAASRVHSVVYTTTDIFTFGLNQGQLGYHQPADNETCQTSPRKVSMSTEIVQVVANDHCTAILTKAFQVILLCNYTQQKLFFPVNRFPSNMTVHRSEPTYMVKLVASGTEHLGAVSNTGDVFTWTCRSSYARQHSADASIRNNRQTQQQQQQQPTLVSAPKRIWTRLNRPHLAAVDASLGQHGEMLVCTVSGHIFKGNHIDKFSQIPHLQRCIRVCANASGAFAAIRSEYVLPPIAHIAASTLEHDLSGSLPHMETAKAFHTQLASLMQDMTDECEQQVKKYKVGADVDQELALKQQQATRRKYNQLALSAVDQAWHQIDQLGLQDASLDVVFCVEKRQVYCHSVIVRCRSNMFHQLVKCADRRSPSVMNGMTIQLEKRASDGRVVIHINQCQLASLLLLLDYVYTDTFQHPMNAFFQIPDLCFQDLDSFTDKKAIQASAHHIQRDLVTLATVFELPQLLSSAQQSFSHAPVPTLRAHLKSMLSKAKGTDVAIAAQDEAHSAYYHQVILRQRCPYFKNLLQPGSVWIQKRLAETEDNKRIQVHLSHLPKAIMDTIIQYMYVDQDKTTLFNAIQHDKEEAMAQFLLDFLCEADFLLLGRLKSITEQVLVPFIKLRSATTILTYADACLADQLKHACMEFIGVNLPVFLGSNMLDALSDALLRDVEAYVRQAQISQAPTVMRRGSPKQYADTEEDDIEFSSSLYALSRGGDGSVVTFDEVLYTYYPEKQPSIAKEKSTHKTPLDTSESQAKQPFTPATANRVKRGTKVQLNDLESELNMMAAASSQRRRSSAAGWAATPTAESDATLELQHTKPSLREIIETEHQPTTASIKSQKSAIPKKISQKERRRLAQQQELVDTPSSSSKPVWGKVPAVPVKPMAKIMSEVAHVPVQEPTSSTAAASSSDRKGKKIYIPESLLEHIDPPAAPSIKETRPLYNPVDSLGASFQFTPIRRYNNTSTEDKASQKKSFQSILKQQELEDNWLKSNKPKKSIALIQKEEQALAGLAQYYIQTLDILSGEWFEIKRL